MPSIEAINTVKGNSVELVANFYSRFTVTVLWPRVTLAQLSRVFFTTVVTYRGAICFDIILGKYKKGGSRSAAFISLYSAQSVAETIIVMLDIKNY